MGFPKTKVAFCENGAGYGGAIISLAAFLKNIPESFDTHIYTCLGTEEYQRLSELGRWRHLAPVSLINSDLWKARGVPFVSMLDNICNVAPYAMRFYSAFRKDGIKIAYLNNDPSCNLAAAMAASLAGIPMVLHARGFSSATRSAQWVLSKITHCIAVSNAVRDQLVASGLHPDKCTVVHEGLDMTLFRPRPPSESVRRELGIGDDEPVVTLVGGLVDWKGQDVLLDACPRIFSAFPTAHVLLVGAAYGKDNGYAKMILAKANAPEFKGRVRALGSRQDIPDILSISSVVVHASTKPEPFGRTFLEGMAMGKPVIASAEGGPCEVIEHNRDGMLVQPREPARLAQAICRLLSEADFAASLAKNAVAKAARYSIENHSMEIEKVLKRFSA